MPHPRKGTPEYEEWIKTPGYAAMRQKVSATLKGRPRSPEASKKAAASNRGKKRSAETRAKISRAAMGNQKGRATKGMKRSAETKVKISQANKNRSPEVWAKSSATWFVKGESTRKGKKLSEEQRAKLSVSFTGRKYSEETKKKWSEQRKGHPTSEETRRKISEANQGRAYSPLALERSMGARKNSSIELFIASKLDAQGIVYIQQKRIGRFWVDFYIPDESKVIEVNGCFWHYCSQCGFNGEGCLEKRASDEKRYETLSAKGYIVEVLWEHDIRKDMKSS